MLRNSVARGRMGQLVLPSIPASGLVHTISRTLAGGAAISIVLVIIFVGGVGRSDARERGYKRYFKEVRGYRIVHILAISIVYSPPNLQIASTFVV
jgi:hypothetical protein